MARHETAPVSPAEGPSGRMVVVEGEKIRTSYAAYLADESRLEPSPVERLFFPVTEGDVCAAVEEACRAGKTLTVSGARTGITGGAVPRSDYVLSLEKMKRVLEIRKAADAYLVRVEPGLTLDELARMVSQKSFDPAVPGAGEFNADAGRWIYPVDPTERSASMGGTCATNASGARTFFYGPTRRYVEALRVVTAAGKVLALERGGHSFDDSGEFRVADPEGRDTVIPLPSYRVPAGVKHAAGYHAAPGMDALDLFVGSEGTLGIITEVTLKLVPADYQVFSAVAFFPSNDHAVSFSIAARESRAVSPMALEFFDAGSLDLLRARKAEEGRNSSLQAVPPDAGAAVYFEQAYTAEEELDALFEEWEKLLRAHGSSMDRTWGGLEPSERESLKAFRHAVPESVNSLIASHKKNDPRIHKVGTDMSVPDEHLREIYDFYREACGESGIRYVIFGHIGDNHLHVNMLPRSYEECLRAKELYMAFARRAVELGGSVSAEHGIGKLKKEFLRIMFGDEGVAEMKRVKQALDPAGILSPGNLF